MKTDFFPRPGPVECLHLRKSCHGTANIGMPRPTYLAVLAGTAKNLGTGAELVPFTMSEFVVPCRKKNGTRTKILAVPCPKRYSLRLVWPSIAIVNKHEYCTRININITYTQLKYVLFEGLRLCFKLGLRRYKTISAYLSVLNLYVVNAVYQLY